MLEIFYYLLQVVYFYEIYFWNLCLIQKDEIQYRRTQGIMQLEREFYSEHDLQISDIEDAGSLLQILGLDSVSTYMEETSAQLGAFSVQLFDYWRADTWMSLDTHMFTWLIFGAFNRTVTHHTSDGVALPEADGLYSAVLYEDLIV